MNTSITERGIVSGTYGSGAESSQSAISWGAILGGAVVAAAVTLILIVLGSALGLTSVSPWGGGASAGTFTVAAAIWLVVTQWLASGFGGYVTGRLRTKWVSVHTHEVFFRDTAHGFVTWAVATLIAVGVMAQAASAVTSGGAHLAAFGAASAPGMISRGAGPMMGSYDLDVLFRGTATDAASAAGPGGAPGPGGPMGATAASGDARGEAMRILANGLGNAGEISPDDRTYLASLVSARTGVTQAEAQARVDAFIAHSKAALDSARKAAAETALFTALAMLVGAFIACVSAALGGRERDIHVAAV